MTYEHVLVFYQPVTPLHVGCGQDVGVVDLPVIRERTTGYPFVPGSGIRGSVRELFEARDRKEKTDLAVTLFGPLAEREDKVEGVRHAGCIAVHDAAVLLFPVRSDREVFLWITCPAVLRRFARDLEVFAPALELPAVEVSPPPGEGGAVGPDSLGPRLHLEEFRFELLPDSGSLKAWAAKIGGLLGISDLDCRTVLVSDRTFHYFVNHATVLLQHNRLTSSKTVEDGGLFSVEAVPPEAVFYGFLGATDARSAGEGAERPNRGQVLLHLRTLGGAMKGSTAYVHLGGDESTGLGVTRMVWTGPQSGSPS